VLIRLAEAPALTVAAYRLGLASLVVVPLGLATGRRQWRGLGLRQWGLALASAACLALHFAFWIASLERTSVASAVVIVTANPILVALAGRLLLGERAPARVMAGIALGLAGGLVIAVGDWDRGGSHLSGDGLALLGALAVTGYYVAGRSLRARLSLWGYVAPVYGGAALLLLLAVGITGAPLRGFPPQTYGYLLLVALVPQLLGHSSLNWALGYLRATLVAVAVMAEPVGATLLAWAVLNEAPPVLSVVGGAFILAGVSLALRRRGS
jgi:drug/metabolite transporter (DMT)-like permease